MVNGISKLQVRTAKYESSKMTDLNHWSTNLALAPEVFLPAHRKMFSSRCSTVNLSKGNPLEQIFGLSNTKEITNLNWTWKLETDAFKPVTILENRTVITPLTPGKYRQEIVVLVDEAFAQIGESWHPGAQDRSQIVVVTEIIPEGKNYIYKMKTYTDTDEHYIEPRHLTPGTAWTRGYTMRGEAAESGGHLERGTDIMFKNNLVKLRKQFKVTDFAAQAVIEIAFVGPDGKAYKSWMDKQEAEYHMAMNEELTANALFSRLGDKPLIDPDSGYPINPGAGMLQQIEFGGNTERYTTLTAELIEAFFDKIVFSRIAPGDLGEVIGYSGHYGMKDFAKALDVWSGGKAIVRYSNINDRKTTGMAKTSLVAGYQYTEYELPTGGTFKLIHNPLYDSKKYSREINPLTGQPLESGRITILDVTGGDKNSINPKDNIQLVRKKDVYGTTIIPGRVGPGGKIVQNPVHSGDYYEVHISDSVGIQITDPSVTGELIPAVNY